jgi:hypothetical protein
MADTLQMDPEGSVGVLTPQMGPEAAVLTPKSSKKAAPKPAATPAKSETPTAPAAPATPTSWQDATAAYGNHAQEVQQLPPPGATKLPEKPQTFQDSVQGWGALAIALGALASLRTRQPLMTAMNAAASAMTAMHDKNQEELDRSFKEWEASTKIAIEKQNYELNVYNSIMRERDEEARIKMEGVAQMYQNPVIAQEIARGKRDYPNDPVKQLDYAADYAKQQTDITNQIKEYTEGVQKWKAFSEAVNQKKQSPEYTNATPSQKSEMMMKLIAESGTGAGRWLLNGDLPPEQAQAFVDRILAGKAPMPTQRQIAMYPMSRQIAQMVVQQDPNLSEQDFPLLQGARKNLQGKDGDTIRSFTVLLHHLAFLESLGKQLQASGIQQTDSPAANRIVASVAKQFGMPEVTNFEAIHGFVADEAVKAILGNSVGGVTDRSAAESMFDIGNTTEQMLGVTNSVRTLAQGQLAGVLSKYRYFIKKGWLSADDIVPEGTILQLSGENKKFSTPDPDDLLHPQGQDVFDQLDGGDPTKRLNVEGTGVTLPNPSVEPASVKTETPSKPAGEMAPEQFKKSAPAGWSGLKKDTATNDKGETLYKVGDKWVPGAK